MQCLYSLAASQCLLLRYPEENSKKHLLSPSAPAPIIIPIVIPLLLRVVLLPLVLNEIRCETTNDGADDSITLTMLFASELSGG